MSESRGHRYFKDYARRIIFFILTFSLAFVGSASGAGAQQQAVDTLTAARPGIDSTAVDSARVDSLLVTVARLQARLDSLAQVIERLQTQKMRVVPAGARVDSAAGAAPADPLAAIRAAAAAALGEPPPPPGVREDSVFAPADASTSARTAGRTSLQSLNPEVTVTGDLFAFMDVDDPGSASFVAREFELALQSWLDPYSRAKIFLGRHAPGGALPPFGGHAHEETEDPDGAAGEHEAEEEAAEEHGAEIDLEEGYVEWMNLPFGLGITLGKFRQRFGALNRWHAHALPAQQLPLPYLAFFGDHGLAQTGISAHWLAPVEVLGGTYEAWVEVTRAANERLFGAVEGVSALGHMNAFYPVSPAAYFELGLTGLAGPAAGNGVRTRMVGLDFALSWQPPARALYREAVLRGGAVYGRIGLPDGTRGEPAFGAFLLGEYRLNRRWVLGARYEYTEDPVQPERSTWLVAPTVAWWQSEYVRLRAEFDSMHGPLGTTRRFLLQTTISMGPHKHSTY